MMDCYRNVVVNKDSTFIYGDKADYNGLLNEARIYSPADQNGGQGRYAVHL